MRLERKKDHIENYLKSEYVGDSLFDDVFIEHNALTQLSIEDIDTSLELFGKKLDFPILINAMTGGVDIAYDINKDLAYMAKDYGLAMATGSEKIALEEESSIDSFAVVREVNEDGLILGNLSSRESLEEARQAVDIIKADGLQIHLNPAQELIMEEGDTNFKTSLENIANLVENLEKPVMVKEVGYGISRKNAMELYELGVRTIDVAGSGGTSFIEIEDLRNTDTDFSDIYGWGNPTAYILETVKERPEDLFIIASGGIKTALDIVKAFVLGADMVAISGEILKYLLHGDQYYARKYLESLIYKTKMLMALVGAKNLEELKEIPYKKCGKLKELTED